MDLNLTINRNKYLTMMEKEQQKHVVVSAGIDQGDDATEIKKVVNTDFSIEIEDFQDGHCPGGTLVPTKMAYYRNKASVGFFSVFDDVLPSDWCERAYDYSISKMKPWGGSCLLFVSLD